MAHIKKSPFEFTYTRPSLDWYETVNVSLEFDKYDYLSLQRRFGPSWWLKGHKYNENREEWEETDIGRIEEDDIPRLIGWARYTDEWGNTHNLVLEISGLGTGLDVIDSFMKIMERQNGKGGIDIMTKELTQLPLLNDRYVSLVNVLSVIDKYREKGD